MGGGGGGSGGGLVDGRLLADPNEWGWRGLIISGKVFLLTMFASLGGVLYGYNQGVFGSVQVMANFHDRYASTLDDSSTKGLLTSILELGAFLGALFAGPISDVVSRKRSISGWCVVFMLGVALQVGATSQVGFIYAGRWFAGMGVGALSMLVPMYNAECAPAGIRGSLVALQQLAITFGILVSYWIAYGTNYIGGTTTPGQKTAAWRIPLALQLVPAVVLMVGANFLPYSPRWLMLHGREEECRNTIAYLRNYSDDDPRLQLEWVELKTEREVELENARERYGVQEMSFKVAFLEYRRLFSTWPLFRRLLLGASAQALQQWTGINAIIYYAPTIFNEIGLTGNTNGLLATGVVGIVNFVMTIPAVLFVDNVGRKPMLMWGEANMAISHATVAAIIAVYGNEFPTHKAAGNGAVFMIYWYIANFAITWGPLAWVVSAEVFPLDLRAKGMSISSATNWIMNFTVAEVTPVMITNIGYKTYITFMCFCIVGFFYSWLALPELKGMSLEEIDEFFHDQSAHQDLERRARVSERTGLQDAIDEVARSRGITVPPRANRISTETALTEGTAGGPGAQMNKEAKIEHSMHEDV